MTFVVEKLGQLTLCSKQMLNWWFIDNADADADDDDDYSLIYQLVWALPLLPLS